MKGVQENVQQEEHNTIVEIESVRFGDEERENQVKMTTTEAVGEHQGCNISFWCNLRNKDDVLSPAMKMYQILEAAHGDNWTRKFDTLESAVQALRGKFLAGTSVPKDRSKGGVGNNLKDGSIKPVPEDFEPAA